MKIKGKAPGSIMVEKKSITEFGIVAPIVVNINKDRENVIVGGHQRVRALQDLGFGSYAWYTIHFNNTQGKFSDIPEAIKARDVIYKFIKEVQEKYTISPEKTFLLGFSQGTILSYAVALNHPETVQKVIALSGYVNPDLLPENMDKINYSKLDFFISHGNVDQEG